MDDSLAIFGALVLALAVFAFLDAAFGARIDRFIDRLFGRPSPHD